MDAGVLCGCRAPVLSAGMVPLIPSNGRLSCDRSGD
jgi:hypothetical protein